MKLPFAVAVVGPTATGKTEAGVMLCRALDGEVISMDSMQVYRGMDIGTAKPDSMERGNVPHHLMDIVEPGASFSVADFRETADLALDDLFARRKLPVLVGGTGLYLNALTYEMDFAGAEADPVLRAELEVLAQDDAGKQQLYARLAQVDPKSANRLHPNDSRRVIRALEIYAVSGTPMSQHEQAFRHQKRKIDPLVLGLTAPREKLYQRINARVDHMMKRGLLREVEALHRKGVLEEGQAAQAIGYKELIQYLMGESTLEEAVELIKQRSRQYAKRQMTWFSKDERVRWFDTSAYETREVLHADLLQAARETQGKEGK